MSAQAIECDWIGAQSSCWCTEVGCSKSHGDALVIL
jgi:hypothetical protein